MCRTTFTGDVTKSALDLSVKMQQNNITKIANCKRSLIEIKEEFLDEFKDIIAMTISSYQQKIIKSLESISEDKCKNKKNMYNDDGIKTVKDSIILEIDKNIENEGTFKIDNVLEKDADPLNFINLIFKDPEATKTMFTNHSLNMITSSIKNPHGFMQNYGTQLASCYTNMIRSIEEHIKEESKFDKLALKILKYLKAADYLKLLYQLICVLRGDKNQLIESGVSNIKTQLYDSVKLDSLETQREKISSDSTIYDKKAKVEVSDFGFW
jgi:hypothetical protein